MLYGFILRASALVRVKLHDCGQQKTVVAFSPLYAPRNQTIKGRMFMKKAKISLAVAGICVALAMVCCTAQAANPVISLKPGDTLVRQFLLYDEIDYRNLGPAQLFLVIGTGDNETLLGNLSISVKSAVTQEEFGSEVDYTIRGIAMPLGGKPLIISGPVASVPNTLTKTITFNSVYGFALVVFYISNLDGNIYGYPVQFTATFGMTVGKK